MLGRRELFKRIVGASVVAVTTKPSDILAEVNKIGAVGLVKNDIKGGEEPSRDRDVKRASWELMHRLDAERQAARCDVRGMAFDIQNKKSWSPAYKSMLHAAEERELRAIQQKLEKDHRLLSRTAKLLGFDIGMNNGS